MFKDINLFVGDNKINFEYTTKDDKITIKTVDELNINSIVEIIYDENIYEIKLNENTNFELGKAGKIFVHVVKSVYKYINNMLDKEMLIKEINLFLNSKVGKKYTDDINNLLLAIEDKEDLSLNNDDEHDRIFNLLVNNKTYLDITKNMSDLELMLLITCYIWVPHIPKIDQDAFNNLINVAKTYDNALEKIWRLGMNFDYKGYDYNLLDDFFVDAKDSWYLNEYISGVNQVNQESIVNKIIATDDKDFIEQILKDDLIAYVLDQKYVSILKEKI